MTKKQYKVICDEINAYSIFKDNERIVFDLLKCDAERICDELNKVAEENEQLKKALLFFVDVANSECSSNWRKDMENDCQRLFNCSYEEAKEKYDDYDGTWWELGL